MYRSRHGSGIGVDYIGGTSSGAPGAVVLRSETGLATHVAAALLLGAHVGVGVGVGVSYAAAMGKRNQFDAVALTLQLGRLR